MSWTKTWNFKNTCRSTSFPTILWFLLYLYWSRKYLLKTVQTYTIFDRLSKVMARGNWNKVRRQKRWCPWERIHWRAVYFKRFGYCGIKPGLLIVVRVAEHACDDASKRILNISIANIFCERQIFTIISLKNMFSSLCLRFLDSYGDQALVLLSFI